MLLRLASRPPGPMLLRLCPFSCGEPAAGATAKFVTLLPNAGFLLFAEAASKAFPSLVRARLYVLVEQNTCEVRRRWVNRNAPPRIACTWLLTGGTNGYNAAT